MIDLVTETSQTQEPYQYLNVLLKWLPNQMNMCAKKYIVWMPLMQDY